MRKHPDLTTKRHAKADFPVSNIRRYLEPGPIVLVTSVWKEKVNIMTMGWYSVMEFTPSLVGCVIASGNYSFGLRGPEFSPPEADPNRHLRPEFSPPVAGGSEP